MWAGPRVQRSTLAVFLSPSPLGSSLLFLERFIFILRESVFCLHVCKDTIHSSWCQRKPEEGARSPEARVTDYCELLCGCWELNWGPLEEQPVSTPNHLAISRAPFYFLKISFSPSAMCMYVCAGHMCPGRYLCKPEEVARRGLPCSRSHRWLQVTCGCWALNLVLWGTKGTAL